MKRLIIFSSPKGKNFEEILDKIFPQEIEKKVFAYLPVEGKNCNHVFTDFWLDMAGRYDAEFIFIDNTSDNPQAEKEHLARANILVITGGNTFELLNNIRNTGLDGALLNFVKKDEFVIAGWSAGALLMSPNIEVASLPHRDGSKTPMDNNKWKLSDLSGLGFVDFEVFPHYEEEIHKNTFEEYNKKKNGKVKALTDDDYIVIDL